MQMAFRKYRWRSAIWKKSKILKLGQNRSSGTIYKKKYFKFNQIFRLRERDGLKALTRGSFVQHMT